MMLQHRNLHSADISMRFGRDSEADFASDFIRFRERRGGRSVGLRNYGPSSGLGPATLSKSYSAVSIPPSFYVS